jgi:hypothetical protein
MLAFLAKCAILFLLLFFGVANMRVIEDKQYGLVCVHDWRPEAVEIVAKIESDETDGWKYVIEPFCGGYAICVYDAEGFALGLI